MAASALTPRSGTTKRLYQSCHQGRRGKPLT
jgi:hypothetical protein